MKAKTYNNAERQECLRIEMTQEEREQLFRLKGYLEGVGAPKPMLDSYDSALEFLTEEHWLHEARFA